MLTGHDMIYFGDRWDGLRHNRQHLTSIFARQNRVLFVEKRPPLRPTLERFRRGDLGLSDLRRPCVRQVDENLFIFRYPLWAPVSGRLLMNQLTGIVRRLSLRGALRRLRISRPIVWFYRPRWVDMLDEIPSACLRLYHVVDEYTSFHEITPPGRRLIEERERKMMARVDAVIVVSQALYEAKRPFNPNTYLVPNGVDYQAYADALADPYLPEDLQAIRPPRLGYSGSIGDRLDLNMLKDLAQENPEWSLVLVGEANVSKQAGAWRALRAMPNVYHLGPVEWSQVPHYAKGFDAGLMPYVQDRHAEAISPLKLYDYLAAGLPIASMDIPAAREFSPYLHLADSPQDFSQAVRAALTDTSPERRQARGEIAARHTWEARAEQLSDLIQARLSAKGKECEAGGS